MHLNAITEQERHKYQKAYTPKRRNLRIDFYCQKQPKYRLHFNLKIRRFTFAIQTGIGKKLKPKLLSSNP
jgi:hypothetical protein